MQDVGSIFNFFFGEDFRVRKINSLYLLDLKIYLSNKKLSPQTTKHSLALLRRVINAAIRYDLYSGPSPKFEMPQFDNKRVRFLSKTEAMNLLICLQQYSKLWHDISAIALMTGLRAGEIFTLRPANFDAQNMLLHIFDTKSGLNRSVPLNSSSYSILKQQNLARAYIFGERAIKDVNKIFRRAVFECGLNPPGTDRRNQVVFHTLRHTFASWLVQDGVPLAVIAQLLGHKDIRMTMRYSHLAPNQGFAAVAKISLSLSN